MRVLVALVVLVIVTQSACKSQVPFGPEAQDDWAKARQKALKLTARLNLEEKVSLATGIGWMRGTCAGNIAPISSVDFPGLCFQDSPAGVRQTDFVSVFPVAINIASTWDRDLFHETALAMGAEFRGKGVNVALTPGVNMARAPAAGRNWEGFGADPYLAGEAARQHVLGIQSNGVIANVKHYVGNEQEHFRSLLSANINNRTLLEIYAYPFLQAVIAGVGSVMCSYNMVNNTYACENSFILNHILKKGFGFEGFVVSDWCAAKSGVPSALAGLDMIMPGSCDPNGLEYFGEELVKAVKNGSVPVSRMDDMAVRILTPWYLMGQDQNFPPTNINAFDPMKSQEVPVAGDHYKLIRKLGAASTILLKNTQKQLPFTSDIKGPGIITYAVIGSDAGSGKVGPNACEDHGCIDGTVAIGWGSGTANFPYLITPLEAIQGRLAEKQQTIAFSLDDWDVELAVKIARKARVAIVFSMAISGEENFGSIEDHKNGDRNNLTLWNNGDNLIQAVAAVNSHTVVVIHSVGPVIMPWADHPNITAIVWAGLPGQESGNSLADVLFGDTNPSGKLVYTIAKDAKDYPAQVIYESSEEHPQIDYTEGLLIDYRWFDYHKIEPAFAFGFGLSYTTFSYTNLRVHSHVEHKPNPQESFLPNTPGPDSPEYYSGKIAEEFLRNRILFTVTADITNTGRVAGHEVAQLYIEYPPKAGEPPKVLRGFTRVYLQPNQTSEIGFELNAQDLSVWMGDWLRVPGLYGVLVGSSSRDIRLTGSLYLGRRNVA